MHCAISFGLLRTHPVYAAGYVIVAVVTIFALAAPLIAPYSPVTADPSAYLLPPGFSHWLGTDVTGMDVLSRVIFAPRADLVIALLVLEFLLPLARSWVRSWAITRTGGA